MNDSIINVTTNIINVTTVVSTNMTKRANYTTMQKTLTASDWAKLRTQSKIPFPIETQPRPTLPGSENHPHRLNRRFLGNTNFVRSCNNFHHHPATTRRKNQTSHKRRQQTNEPVGDTGPFLTHPYAARNIRSQNIWHRT